MKTKAVKWDKPALIYFSEAIRYIRKDSPQNADKIKTEILSRITTLSNSPEIHAPDKYKQNNNGSYRAFELYRLRIAYIVKDDEIIITRVRHTSQEPLEY